MIVTLTDRHMYSIRRAIEKCSKTLRTFGLKDLGCGIQLELAVLLGDLLAEGMGRVGHGMEENAVTDRDEDQREPCTGEQFPEQTALHVGFPNE